MRVGARGNGDLPDELSRLANLLATTDDLDSALHEVAELARAAVPGCDGSAVVVRDPNRPRAVAATDGRTRALAGYQQGHEQGPGVEALQYGEPRRIDDMISESRWPGFCAEARQRGLGSALAVPLRMARDGSGALTLYAEGTHVFAGLSHDVALLFAERSAIALSNADLYFASRRLVENLHAALDSRAVIEQAKGIIMSRERCSAQEAFDALRAQSQHTHQKLRDVARETVSAVSPGDAAHTGRS